MIVPLLTLPCIFEPRVKTDLTYIQGKMHSRLERMNSFPLFQASIRPVLIGLILWYWGAPKASAADYGVVDGSITPSPASRFKAPAAKIVVSKISGTAPLHVKFRSRRSVWIWCTRRM